MKSSPCTKSFLLPKFYCSSSNCIWPEVQRGRGWPACTRTRLQYWRMLQKMCEVRSLFATLYLFSNLRTELLPLSPLKTGMGIRQTLQWEMFRWRWELLCCCVCIRSEEWAESRARNWHLVYCCGQQIQQFQHTPQHAARRWFSSKSFDKYRLI